MTEHLLDLHGATCPDPLIQVRETLHRLGRGDQLVVWLDYPLAVENISRWLEGSPHTLVKLEKTKASEWRLVIAKG